jgi:hypothetical protein
MLEKLREDHPWPSARPPLTPQIQGWFHGQRVFARFCGERVKLVLELGTWLGLSAEWFAQNCPHAHIVCIDHWKGDADIARSGIKLPPLPDQWYANMWPWRHRMTAITADMVEGVRQAAACGLKPDIVYIDGAHDVASVEKDLTAVLDHFPEAQILGDDWWLPSVREAVDRVLRQRNISERLRPEDSVWYLA